MSVTINDMEMMATTLPEVSFNQDTSSNVIEVNDLGDDFGMSLLANKKYSNTSSNPVFSSPEPQISINGLNSVNNIQVSQGEQSKSFDFGMEATELPTINIMKENSSFQPSNTFGPGSSFANQQSSTAPSVSLAPAGPPKDPVKETAEKSELINKLQRLEAKGFPVSKRFTMDNALDEIKSEYTRLVDARQLETSIRFQRNMMMSVVTGAEWMNNKFDPFDVKLEGWSESVHTNVEDFDEIFEELYDKYKDRGKMAPEMRLMMAVAGSGFMCHVSNSFFRQKMPTMDDVLKSNPMLAKQMAQAAAAQAGPGFGNFMGMAMGMPGMSPPGAQGMGGNQGPPNMPASAMAMDPPGPTGGFFGSSGRSAANPSQMSSGSAAVSVDPSQRREMKGPSGVDDILRTFEDVRRAEMETIGVRTMPNNSFVQPEQSNQPAMVAVSELQSVASDDYSQADSTRSGMRRGRGRRPAPVGASLSLDV
jgi:hypothetical protein